MTGSILLDVVIGLVFLYLLYSLFATLIQEIIATQFSFRAKILEKAIIRMLEDGKSTTCSALGDRFGAFKILLIGKQMKTDMKVATAFYNHPLIKYLAEDKWFSKPAYLSAQNFSKVVVDLLRGGNAQPPFYNAAIDTAISTGTIKDFLNNNTEKINNETGTYLKSLWYDAGQDIEKFKGLLEKWYDDTMERATGWYKKYTQFILFIVGFLIAMLFNVNTIQIAKNLSSNPKARAQMVQAANVYLQNNKNLPLPAAMSATQTDSELNKRAKDLQMQILKLDSTDIENVNNTLGLGHDEWKNKWGNTWPRGILGWLITALAISLGAPFWFDLLNKLMRLRSSGDKIDTPAPTTTKK